MIVITAAVRPAGDAALDGSRAGGAPAGASERGAPSPGRAPGATRQEHEEERVATTERAVSPTQAIVMGGVVALVLAVVWIVATEVTGLAFHFHPLLVAGAAPWTARQARGAPLPGASVGTAVTLGLAAVAVGWLGLAAIEATPSATLIDDQPGGFGGEVVAAAGALIGAWWALRREAN